MNVSRQVIIERQCLGNHFILTVFQTFQRSVKQLPRNFSFCVDAKSNLSHEDNGDNDNIWYSLLFLL